MSLRKTIYTGGFDWLTFGIYLILVLIGAISLYSVEYNPNARFEFFNIAGSQGKYLIIIVFSVLLFYLAYLIEWRFWSSFSIPIYGLGILFLILVLIIGSEIKGSKSWFNLMGFSFQPSEFAKLATAMAISAYFSQFKRDIHQTKIVFQAFGLIFIPVFLILLQPDAGSALIFMSIFLLFYRIGLPHFYYLIGAILIITFILTLMYNPGIVSLGASIIAIVILSLIFIQNGWVIFLSIFIGALSIYFYLFYFGLPIILILGILLLIVSIYLYMKKGYGSAMLLPMSLSIIMALSYGTDFVFNNLLKAHQQDRINVWLNPEKCDPRGSLYNVLQAKTAIGSGGLFGKGFLQGNMTHLNYVPEQATDFIFSAIGEEHGFFGIAIIISLFAWLIIRIINIGERSKSSFVTYFAYTVAGYLLTHFIMNIGMNMGILPVIGIPLPFISKGGSSLMVFSMMMGILLKMDNERILR